MTFTLVITMKRHFFNESVRDLVFMTVFDFDYIYLIAKRWLVYDPTYYGRGVTVLNYRDQRIGCIDCYDVIRYAPSDTQFVGHETLESVKQYTFKINELGKRRM